MIVEPIHALVIKVNPRRTGEGQYGPWSLQAIELRDNSGTINAVIWNKDELTYLQNKEITLGATKSDKGWAGCMAEDNHYTAKDGSQKTTRQIKASGQYRLELAGAVASNGNSAPAPTPETAPQATRMPVAAYSAPSWGEYMAVVKAAHDLAEELETDDPHDRSRARMALVNCILIAYGRKDFRFETEAGEQGDGDEIPF
jgi:arylsulfatase A-like enzyme